MQFITSASSAANCRIAVNPDAAANLAEGSILDGIGNAMFWGNEV
jgi:isoquinoline 1-oxidoreductase beta subunit